MQECIVNVTSDTLKHNGKAKLSFEIDLDKLMYVHVLFFCMHSSRSRLGDDAGGFKLRVGEYDLWVGGRCPTHDEVKQRKSSELLHQVFTLVY